MLCRTAPKGVKCSVARQSWQSSMCVKQMHQMHKHAAVLPLPQRLLMQRSGQRCQQQPGSLHLLICGVTGMPCAAEAPCAYGELISIGAIGGEKNKQVGRLLPALVTTVPPLFERDWVFVGTVTISEGMSHPGMHTSSTCGRTESAHNRRHFVHLDTCNVSQNMHRTYICDVSRHTLFSQQLALQQRDQSKSVVKIIHHKVRAATTRAAQHRSKAAQLINQAHAGPLGCTCVYCSSAAAAVCSQLAVRIGTHSILTRAGCSFMISLAHCDTD